VPTAVVLGFVVIGEPKKEKEIEKEKMEKKRKEKKRKAVMLTAQQ
jgi:hypothetical protein